MQRRKVQAQRKFAQGAHIPSSHNTSTPKSSYKIQKDDKYSLFISTTATTATHLLDILSLKDSHEHLQPFVLLERLPSSNKSPQKKPTPCQQEHIQTRSHRMCIRPSTQLKKRDNTYKRKSFKNKYRRISLLINEDETPLLYLKNKNKRKGAKKATKKQKECKVSSVVEEMSPCQPTLNDDNCTDSILQFSKATTETFNTSIQPVSEKDDAIVDSTVDQCDSDESQINVNPFQVCINVEKEISPKSIIQPSQSSIVMQPQPSKIIQPKPSMSILNNENHETCSVHSLNINDIAESEHSCNTPLKTEELDILTYCNGISTTKCTAEYFITIDQVLNAQANDFAGLCHSCLHCRAISKIREVLKLYTVLVNNYYNLNPCNTESSNDTGDLYIFIPAIKQNISRSYITYNLNLTSEMNSIIRAQFYIDVNKTMHFVSADMVPKKPEMVIINLPLESNYTLFSNLLEFISKSQISYHMKVTNKYTAKIESIEISGDESEPEYKGPTIEENSVCSKYSSIRIHKQNPVTFPKPDETAQKLNAPEFFPSEEEFTDPIEYFEKIMPIAVKFGICKVVAPRGFAPKCILDESVRFTVTNQYISRLFRRWGPGLKEFCAIKAYLASQSVIFNRPPLLDGIEVDLPKLYGLVQKYGGLPKVIERKRWVKIAEEMKLTNTQKIGNKLDKIYVKYILPYDTLSQEERKELMNNVEINWEKKHQRMLKRASKPLHRQKRLLGESETSEEEEVEDDDYVSGALNEAEDCITKGRLMKHSTYQKVANRAAETYLNNSATKTIDEIEKDYWTIVTEAKEHVCVNSASIDTGEEGYGFTKNRNDCFGIHPWNLKVLSKNKGNVLKSLGPVLGVTVPTLHLGMTFSTSCWHRDPHGLPWIEYMHSGPGKIWYGIPDEQSENFRRAVEILCPTSCQKKSIWLPSDIVMIPPNQLLEHKVCISRVEQTPGDFVIIFPKAYSSSISTGYTESESVYFAPCHWLDTIEHTFMELRESCEPTMFSVEQLLLSVARDPEASPNVLKKLYPSLENIIRKELINRLTLARYKVQDKSQQKRLKASRKRPAGAWNVREQEECGICQATLYLSRVWGLTDKKQSVCLQHALEILNKKQRRARDIANVGLEVFLTEMELERVITNLHKRCNQD